MDDNDTEELQLPYDATSDDAYCEGDPTPDEIDWDAVERLALLQLEVQQAPKHEQPLLNAALLTEMYGEDLVVL